MKLSLDTAKMMMEESGGSLYLRGSCITSCKVRRLQNGDYVEDRYLYADGILTHVRKKKIVNIYTYFIGKIPNKNVVFDGKNYAHCSNLREGISDLLFKSAKDRGADQYKGIALDNPMPIDEMKTMYRVITGACQQGTQAFIESLGDSPKEEYTVREVINLTKGQYGNTRFAEFFQ